MSVLGEKPKGGGDGGGGASWLLTYGDLVTLLMAFFVMLFAMSSVEQEKFEAFLSGLSAFDNPAAEKELSPVGDPVSPEVTNAIPPVMSGSSGLQEFAQRVNDAVADAGHVGKVELQYEERGLALVVGTDDVLFESGSARVTDVGRQIIAAVAPELQGISNEIVVEGHTDDVPLDRNGYTNWNLSTDRAVAVVNALVGEHRIAPTRLEAAGFGEFDPREVGTGREARRRNRRVEIVILTPPEGASTGGAGTVQEGIEDPIGDVIRDPAGLGELVRPTGN